MADVLERGKRSAPSKTTKPKPREDSRRAAPPARSKADVSKAPHASAKRTRGRPMVVDDSIVVSVRLPRDLLDRIDALIAESGSLYRDRSEFLRGTIARAAPLPTKAVYDEQGSLLGHVHFDGPAGGSWFKKKIPVGTESYGNGGIWRKIADVPESE